MAALPKKNYFLQNFDIEKKFGLEKCFLLPFLYLLIDFKKLWTKIFGLISYLTGCLKNLHLVKKEPIYTRFMQVAHEPHIIVSADKLLFTQKFYILTHGIRTYKDEHFELL